MSLVFESTSRSDARETSSRRGSLRWARSFKICFREVRVDEPVCRTQMASPVRGVAIGLAAFGLSLQGAPASDGTDLLVASGAKSADAAAV